MKFNADKYTGSHIDRIQVGMIKDNYKPGTRILLKEMEGENILSGTKGTVSRVDDIGQIHMSWDCGSSLPLNLAVDQFHIITE